MGADGRALIGISVPSQVQSMTLYVRVCPHRCVLQKTYSDGRPSVRPTSGKKKHDKIGLLNMLQSVYIVVQ